MSTSDPWGGWATLVRADNPGPMTLDGTNTWILREPGRGAGAVTVVDPGPLVERHLQAVLAEVRGEGGVGVGRILLTHHHLDHCEGAARLSALTGAPVHGGEHGWAGADLPDDLELIETPGHTADSVCLLAKQAGLLLTGDTVLGSGSTIIAAPDGRLDAYLDSLEKLAVVVQENGVRHLLPGHGPARTEPAAVIAGYLAHRRARLEEVRQAVAAGAGSAREVVEIVYAQVPAELWPAAEVSVQAQLDYLNR